MRALFVILLILNIVYFAWQFIRSPSEVMLEASVLKDIEPIVLLSEAKTVKAEAVAAQETDSKEKEAQERVTKEKADKEIIVAAKAEEKEDKKAPVDKSIKSKIKKEVKKSVADVVVSSGAGKNEVSNSIADKSNVSKSVANKSKNNVAVKNKKSAALPGQCFTVGPFRDLKKLRGLTRAIKSYVVETDFRGKAEKTPPLYWVYTAAEKTKKQTLKIAARLRAKNIKDFYIINSDRKVNSISLGRFKNKKGVQKFVKKLEKWGFDVIVEVVRKDVTIYWLDYKLAAGRSIPKSIFLKYRPSKKQATSRLNRKCD